ncbi:aldehyde dehydrogenase family protein [Nocardia ninae]|uniref:Aldehyde dehydrogenase n=1 Tax=Nocardia ninae NBRC 108245 TaxID=1210091 RepID=A0A511MDR4_9NOCA|nr:aldehyde dehydrogenase family protein [Nocardia ninae]GEM38287.1 aldehyde dehydrogenase [Nocardia ninae NBRC 108245]
MIERQSEVTVEGFTAAVGESFASFDPADGAVIGTYPVHSAAEVGAAVRRAREAQASWADAGFDERRRVLTAWRSALLRRRGELEDLVHAENGKSRADATIEVIVAVQHIDWAAKHARKVLGPRRVASGPFMVNQAAWLEYRPLGVIGILGPWDFPVFGPVGTAAYALAGGNTVVLKHSEYTPGIGEWLAESFGRVAGDDRLFQTVTGADATGEALCRSGVNKISFTGSLPTARKVLAACAETLTPVLVDAGASDALLVDEDADLAAAADAAVWGAMSNAGQVCISVERAYVHERVYEAFADKVVAIAGNLKAGAGQPIGPITMPEQVEVVRQHIADAVERGGRALVGGLDGISERYIQPTVLVDVPEDALVVRAETFGPVLVISKVADMDEALAKTDATGFGLGGAVFARARGMDIARRMRSGMTSVNSVVAYAGVPALPYGGVGNSGFGRIHGPDGLREWTAAKAITRQRFSSPVRTTTFTRRPLDNRVLAALARVLYGRG